MLGALPALGLLGTSIFDGGGMSAGLGLLGGMAGGLIGSNTPHPQYNVEQTAPYVGFNTFGQDYPVGAQGMLQGYLGQPMAGAPGTGFGYGASGLGNVPNPIYGSQGAVQGYGYGSNGANYLGFSGSGGFGSTGYGGYSSPQAFGGSAGGGWYDARNSVTAGPPYGSLTQYQGHYDNSFGGPLGGNGSFHLGSGSFNFNDPYGMNVAGNYFSQGAQSAGISTGPDGFGAVGLFTGYDVGWGSLAAQQQAPQPQAPSYGGYGGYGYGGQPTGGGYGYVGAGGSTGFGGGQGGYSGGQQGGYGQPPAGYGYGAQPGYGSYGYAPPMGYGYTPSSVAGGYAGGYFG